MLNVTAIVKVEKNAQISEFRMKKTENGNEYGLFVKEDFKIGDLIIEYVGKVVQKQNTKTTA